MPGDEHEAAGGPVSVETMEAESVRLPYKDDGSQVVVEFPYQGGQFSFVAVMPKNQSIADFVSGLTGSQLAEFTNSLDATSLHVYLPKIHMEENVEIQGSLAALGMGEAMDCLTGRADFSGITTTMPLCIQKVLHQTYLDLDEDGTEAAAATEVIIGDAGMGPWTPPEPIVVRFDHPFLFFIRDVEHDAVLFVGLYLHP